MLYTRSRLKRERLKDYRSLFINMLWSIIAEWKGFFFSLFVYYRPPGGGRFLCYGYKNIIWFTADLCLFIRKKILCNVTIPAGTQRWINVEFRFRRVIQRRLNIKINMIVCLLGFLYRIYTRIIFLIIMIFVNANFSKKILV